MVVLNGGEDLMKNLVMLLVMQDLVDNQFLLVLRVVRHMLDFGGHHFLQIILF
jgi:hypothetical protein